MYYAVDAFKLFKYYILVLTVLRVKMVTIPVEKVFTKNVSLNLDIVQSNPNPPLTFVQQWINIPPFLFVQSFVKIFLSQLKCVCNMNSPSRYLVIVHPMKYRAACTTSNCR